MSESRMIHCKYCTALIPEDAVICTSCGRQVEKVETSASAQPNIVINNANSNVNSSYASAGTGTYGTPKSRTTSIALCCLGFIGIGGMHKFYEGKNGMGVLYLFTVGLCFLGTIIDLLALLKQPETYYV